MSREKAAFVIDNLKFVIVKDHGKENRKYERRKYHDPVLQKLDRLFQKAEGHRQEPWHNQAQPKGDASGHPVDARHR
jgi:hypothetical protein